MCSDQQQHLSYFICGYFDVNYHLFELCHNVPFPATHIIVVFGDKMQKMYYYHFFTVCDSSQLLVCFFLPFFGLIIVPHVPNVLRGSEEKMAPRSDTMLCLLSAGPSVGGCLNYDDFMKLL